MPKPRRLCMSCKSDLRENVRGDLFCDARDPIGRPDCFMYGEPQEGIEPEEAR
jgi:hypothetical protein